MNLKARTKLACKIANIDPLRFNEAVHFNKYACAPRTSAGTARVFERDDIVALRIYGMLLEIMNAENAGWFACEMLAKFKGHEDVNAVTFVKTNWGAGHVMDGEVSADTKYSGLHEKAFWLTFDIKMLRAFVTEQLEHENSIIGDE